MAHIIPKYRFDWTLTVNQR